MGLDLAKKEKTAIAALRRVHRLALACRVSAGTKDEGYEFDLISGVFSLWKKLRAFLENDTKRDAGTIDDRFREMLMYLQKNYAEEVSLNEIAEHIGLSRSECCRYFKKQSGQTIFDYLTRYRLHKSMDLLIGTDHDIAQIAQTCGFSGQSYYTKRFRELTGITPRQYRLQQRQYKEQNTFTITRG